MLWYQGPRSSFPGAVWFWQCITLISPYHTGTLIPLGVLGSALWQCLLWAWGTSQPIYLEQVVTQVSYIRLKAYFQNPTCFKLF